MSAIEILLSDACRVVRKSLPSLIVVVSVMLLLRGFWGSLAAIQLQIGTFLGSLFGAGDGLTGVLLHTLPLAIAAAIATFAIVSGSLRFESFSSCVALACIILIGTSIGGFLRRLAPEPPLVRPSQSANAENTPERSIVGVPRLGPRTGGGNSETAQGETAALSSPSIAIADAPHLRLSLLNTQIGSHVKDADSRVRLAAAPVVAKSPWQRLRDVEWMRRPDLSKAAPREIPALDLLPAVGGAVGVVTRAVNQILGYFVAYQPRLFLAAIVAGGWVGWSWHHRLHGLHERVLEFSSDDAEPTDRRRAA